MNNRIDERYRHDPEFTLAVKAIRNMMEQTQLTPLDIRDAAYLARYLFELENPRPISISSDLFYRINNE